MRQLQPLVHEAIASVMPLASLRHVAFSHYETDECGGMDALLAAAPAAVPLSGRINAMVNADAFARPARALGDGETLTIGAHRLRWLDAPHLPHGWECGYLMDETTGTLLCGDLFTQGGSEHPPVTSADILGPSEAFRRQLDYFSNTKHVRSLVTKLAATAPTTLACMHGSAWQGDGAKLLGALAGALAGSS